MEVYLYINYHNKSILMKAHVIKNYANSIFCKHIIYLTSTIILALNNLNYKEFKLLVLRFYRIC